ncbi:Hypothetical predicted protein [Paramuricea clavata]|uniref:Uncharacterized protein n=1 Tax=Paramuricea clavata TaxID=317549 RepID=A0A6S7KVH2_PARCT|nr:Hypothetical predicted protein [Paramuricea clavata]
MAGFEDFVQFVTKQADLATDPVYSEELMHDLDQRFEFEERSLSQRKDFLKIKTEQLRKVVTKQLHSFSDASRTGYGQTSYLRLVNENGQIHGSFVAGKARVTPQKTVSIPRLEFAAATVSEADMLKAEVDYEDVDFYWTDSEVVLGFINNESRRFHVYVANRTEDNWPQQRADHTAFDESNPEVKKVNARVVAVQEDNMFGRERVRNEGDTSAKESINVEDIRDAETVVIKWMQHEAFATDTELLQQMEADNDPKDREFIKKKKAAMKTSSVIHRLDPFLDNSGVLKSDNSGVERRLSRADMTEGIKR